jgi:hypothetical protein
MWDNHRAFRNQVDRSNPQTPSSGTIIGTGEHFTWYRSDDLRAKIALRSCRQYKLGHFVASRTLHWDEIIDEDNDDRNRQDTGAPSGRMTRPSDGNDHEVGQSEEDT